MEKKVAAITVAYNRKELLIECINSLLNQTKEIDRIFILDNNSTDGTEKLLREKGYLNNKKVDYLKLSENIGATGGFYCSLKKAYEEGYDYFWLMDDDVLPEKTALEELLKAEEIVGTYGFLCSKVVGLEGQSMNLPSVDLRSKDFEYPQWERFISKGMIQVRSATFVSILIPRNIVKEVGLPIKEMFIWGDDTEYTERISMCFPSYFVGKSKVLHKRKMAKSLNIVNEEDPKRIKNYYYYYRNNIYNRNRYYKKKIVVFIGSALSDMIKLVGKKYALRKLVLIIKGLIFGFFFSPKITKL